MSKSPSKTVEASAKPQAPAPKKADKGSLLNALSAEKKTAKRSATDPTTAILTALKDLRRWAKSAPFLTFSTAAEKREAKNAGVLTRGQYVALIGEAEKLVKGCKSLKELKPHRERVGQKLYYGARVRKGSGPLAGHVGFTRPASFPDGYDRGPSFAGTFSSRVQSA